MGKTYTDTSVDNQENAKGSVNSGLNNNPIYPSLVSLLGKQKIQYRFKSYQAANHHQGIKIHVIDQQCKKFSFDWVLQNIAIPLNIVYGDYFNNLIVTDSGLRWCSYGASFALDFNGDVILTKNYAGYSPEFTITGAHTAFLSGKGYAGLGIKARQVEIKDDVVVDNLEISAGRMLNDKMLEAKCAKFAVPEFINSGAIYVLGDGQLDVKMLDNANGRVYFGGSVTLRAAGFNNVNGSVSGVQGTSLEIGEYFVTNDTSDIGFNHQQTGSRTSIIFKNKFTVERLGTIRGSQVQWHNPPIVNAQGIISATEEILLIDAVGIIMPQVSMQTPVLRMQAPDFKLENQAYCDRTILEIPAAYPLVLNNDYNTNGTFEIHEIGVTKSNVEQKMLDRFGELKDYVLANMPQHGYDILLRARIIADQGFEFLIPNAKIVVDLEDFDQDAHKKDCGLIALNGNFNAYTTECDLAKVGVTALNGFIWAPRGCQLGRLVEDPGRRAFATFYAHAHATHSISLGGHIHQVKYNFLGDDVPIYDGRHLLNMPITISNGSFINVNRFIKIIGEFNNQGTLNVKNLTIDSTGAPSVWEAGIAYVEQDCNLTGNFILKRTITDLIWKYYCNNQWGIPVWHPPGVYTFCNSDPSELIVLGKLSGNSIITNEASILDVKHISPEIQINSNDFQSTLYQQFIDGTIEQSRELSNTVDHSVRGRRGIHAINGMAHNGCIPYAMGFLSKTNNFKDSQKVFPAVTSIGSTVVISARNTKLEGMISAPNMLIVVTKGGKLALGSPNPYYINPKNPIRDLGNHKFNIHLTFVNDQLRQDIATAVKPKFHFLFRERFWFDDKASQDFYNDIIDHIVIKLGNGEFKKPDPQTVFQLSPNYLLTVVNKQCLETLMRGYIYPDRAIDLEFIKELHRNTTEYLQEIKFSREEFQQALILYGQNTANVKLPEKPIIYYQAIINDLNLTEVLYPYLYIPIDMINAVRAQLGGLVQIDTLLILPDNLTPKQLIASTKDRFGLSKSLINFFEQNPNAAKYLEDTALAAQTKALTAKLESDTPESAVAVLMPVDIASDFDVKSQVNIGGTVRAKKLGVLVEGAINVSADLATEDTLLASFFDDVIMTSIVERVGSAENFDDVIKVQAKVAAKHLLEIYAGKDVIFHAAETASGPEGTYIQALGRILDLEVSLVHQRVQHFFEKRKSGTIRDTYVAQQTSKHTSAGDFMLTATDEIELHSPQFDLQGDLKLASYKKAIITDVTETYEHSEQITSKKSSILGSKTRSSSSMTIAQRSRGALLNVKRLQTCGLQGVELRNVFSRAELNQLLSPEGTVELLQGHNRLIAAQSSQSSDLFWQSSKSSMSEQIYYTPSIFVGAIEIDAKQVIIEMVRGKSLDFLHRLEIKEGQIVYRELQEYFHQESKSVSGPGIGLATLVGVTIGILTHGTGASLAGKLSAGLAKGATGAMMSAGFSTICSQATIAILSNDGDPFKAIKSMAHSDSVKSLATSIISAGVLHELCGVFNIPMANSREWLEHAKYNLAKSSVSAALNISIHNKQPGQAILDGLADAAITTAFSPVIQKIDFVFDTDAINMATHTVLQSAVGAAKNVILDDPNGAIIGALEGVISARLPRMLRDRDATLEKSEKAKAKLKDSVAEYQQQLLQDILLQEDRAALINKIEEKIKLFAIQQAETQGVVINVTEHLANIAGQINTLDRNQIKDLNKSLDLAISSQNTTGKFEMVPAIAPLALPLATQFVLRVVAPVFFGYLVNKAIQDTKKGPYKNNQFQEHDEDFSVPGFMPHENKPTILPTPIADPTSSSSEFPIVENQGNIFPGHAPEIKKPIIFSGGLDYKDKQFFDSLTAMERSAKGDQPPRENAPNPDHGHVSVPEKFRKDLDGRPGTLPGFPDSKHAGKTNDKRDKWILKDKTFVTWDKRHGAVDLFNKTGKKHLGKYDPNTGNKLKDPKPERTSKPS